jgi:hypothetical protein
LLAGLVAFGHPTAVIGDQETSHADIVTRIPAPVDVRQDTSPV